jgi:predicted nucleic acid-binding protein
VAFRKAIEQFQCFVATVSVYELLFGVAKGGGIADEDKLLALLTSVPFDESEARLAAEIHRDLIRQNSDIGPKDVMIAATCIVNNLSLLTANARHFRRVP